MSSSNPEQKVDSCSGIRSLYRWAANAVDIQGRAATEINLRRLPLRTCEVGDLCIQGPGRRVVAEPDFDIGTESDLAGYARPSAEVKTDIALIQVGTMAESSADAPSILYRSCQYKNGDVRAIRGLRGHWRCGAKADQESEDKQDSGTIFIQQLFIHGRCRTPAGAINGLGNRCPRLHRHRRRLPVREP
jgi:hypothetical protein